MLETPEIQTARLLLLPLQLADADAIQQHFAHWEVVRYLNARVPWPYPDDGAASFIRDICLPAVRRGQEWHWTLRLLEVPSQVIGCISLMNEPDNNRGFWLAPTWQGQGYISEACVAINDFWFIDVQQPVMRVPKALANNASRRVSQREGMRVVAQYESDYVCGRLPTELWELGREEWLKRSSRTRHQRRG